MKAKPFFEIQLEYLQSEFLPLNKIGVYLWAAGEVGKPSQATWRFPLHRIKDVEAILGKPIEFDNLVPHLIGRMPLERETAEVDPFKGVSGYTVDESELPRCYIVIEHGRKEETDDGEIIITQPTHEVPSENVNVMRQVLKNIDEARYKDGKIPNDVLANGVLQALGITRFHRESGTFDWAKFFGNRKDYFAYYYYPLKVLSFKNEVIHHKNGLITKIKQTQTELVTG